MPKSLLGLLLALLTVAGCSTPQPAAKPQAAATRSAAPAGQSAAAAVNSAPAADNQEYETVFVPAPTGSLLGGGSVRVPKTYSGNDENALLGNIRRLNAAAGAKDERPYVVSAVSKATGVSQRELQAQQDVLRLRFGELCAINAIARGDSNKVQEIATLKSKGQSWTALATSNGVNIASVTQTTRNAADLTASSYSNATERQKGGQRKLEQLGAGPPLRPQGE